MSLPSILGRPCCDGRMRLLRVVTATARILPSTKATNRTVWRGGGSLQRQLECRLYHAATVVFEKKDEKSQLLPEDLASKQDLSSTPGGGNHKNEVPEWYIKVRNAEREQREAQEEKIKAQLAAQEEIKAKLAAQEEKFAEFDGKIVALQAQASHKGVTTNAQFYHTLFNEYKLTLSHNGEETWNTRAEWPFRPNTYQAPPETCPEADKKDGTVGVQTQVSQILQALINHDTTCNNLAFVSTPDPVAYQKVSFGTRRPDVVNYQKGNIGSLSITSFGDLKARGSGDFTVEQKGHILDMGRSYMEKVGLNRPFLVVFLSDGKRWQFFRLRRGPNNTLTYFEGPVIEDFVTGWEHYLGLLTASLDELGHVMPNIRDVELKSALGRGGSASVYEGLLLGNNKETAVVVKVYAKDIRMHCSLQAEEFALNKLKDVDHTPTIVGIREFQNLVEETAGKALLTTPVGTPVLPVQGGLPVDGCHLQQLVLVLQQAHEKGLAHRDLKPQNIYLCEGNIILNDWSSSKDMNVDEGGEAEEEWEGTVGYSVHPQETSFHSMCWQSRDLVGLVRCSYSLLFKECPPNTPKEAEAYWNKELRQGSHWGNALLLAKHANYKALGELLQLMK